MKKTLKIILLLLLTGALCVAIVCLCACTNGADGKDGVNGTNGKDGANGQSAYEIWLDEGYTGSQADFLNWLKGSNGIDGTNGQDGKDGVNGLDGKSAYQIWLDNGHSGTETDFLEWLKGSNGVDGSNGENGHDGTNGTDGTNGLDGLSAYEIFVMQYPYYDGTEEQWMIALVNGNLKIYSVTFKSEVSENIVKYVVSGYDLTDIPAVPAKQGQTNAEWDVKDFTNITQNIEVTAVYDMRKYVTFHNEFTDDEDVTITVNYGEAIENVPEITAKAYNDSKWSVDDFSCITEDMQANAIYTTIGLEYALINQQTEYRVSKGNMDDATEELFISNEYNGKPVTVIHTKAFFECENVKIAHIPNSIKEIRSEAFNRCFSLSEITLPYGITEIGDETFNQCWELKSIVIPDSVTSIGRWAFNECKSLTDITLPDSVTTLGGGAFSFCESLINIKIPDVIVLDYTFAYCTNLKSVTIPDSVTLVHSAAFKGCANLESIILSGIKINEGVFMDCDKLSTVYFKGTQEEFNSQMDVDSKNNEPFTDAMVYFYSQTEPTDNGYYWYYDTDGVTPIIWEKES